jgi:hypothetical protein
MQLTCAPVLAEVLTKTQFMQRLGDAFGRFAAGIAASEADTPPASSAVPGVSTATNQAAGGPGITGSQSGTSGRSSLTPAAGTSMATASTTGRSSLTPAAGTSMAASANSTASNTLSVVATPWTPPLLRIIACVRQWLLLLAHHPTGRELLARGSGAGAGSKGVAAGGLLTEVALALWSQLSQSLRGILQDNAAASRVAPASGLAASAAGRLLASAASMAFAAFGGGGAGSEKVSRDFSVILLSSSRHISCACVTGV